MSLGLQRTLAIRHRAIRYLIQERPIWTRHQHPASASALELWLDLDHTFSLVSDLPGLHLTILLRERQGRITLTPYYTTFGIIRQVNLIS